MYQGGFVARVGLNSSLVLGMGKVRVGFSGFGSWLSGLDWVVLILVV